MSYLYRHTVIALHHFDWDETLLKIAVYPSRNSAFSGSERNL